MPEQLAFNQIVGNGRGVDRHEGTGLACAEFVNGFGDQFLARARFAGDQHCEIVAQHPRDHPVDPLHGRAAADEGHIVGRIRLRARRWLPRRRLPDRLGQIVQVEGFGKIFEGLAVARAHRGIERVLGAQHNDGHLRRRGMNRCDACESIAIFEHDVGKHDVEAALRQQLVTSVDPAAQRDVIALVAERLRNDGSDGGVVLDEQHASGHSPSPFWTIGRLMRKCV